MSLLWACLILFGCSDSEPPGSSGDPAEESQKDASLGAGSEKDSGVEHPGRGPCRQDAGACRCVDDLDCPTGQLCSPKHECIEPLTCEGKGCTATHPCNPRTGECDCTVPDRDKDDVVAKACGGNDCDDSRSEVNPNGVERCFNPLDPDAASRDEDCNSKTFARVDSEGRPIDGDGDADGDGYISDRCVNEDPEEDDPALRTHRGDDCNDGSINIHPAQTETCDGLDNNCNDMVDELEVESEEGEGTELVPNGLLRPAYPDVDGDGYGDSQAEPLSYCFHDRPEGMVFDNHADSDDGNPDIHPGAPELCDGKDNDGDGEVDGSDDGLVAQYSIPQTQFACEGGAWSITACPSDDVRYCGGPLEDGCATDATRIQSCRACESDCKFGCGEQGCDEVVQLALGSKHSCALSTEGRVACWGRPALGRLGHDSTGSSTVPMWLPRIPSAHAVASGGAHSCAIVGEERELWCWGSNSAGQLGADDSVSETVAPIFVLSSAGEELRLSDVQHVQAGDQHTCAIVGEGSLMCFGEQAAGRLGDGEVESGMRYYAAPAFRPSGLPFPPLFFPVDDAQAIALGDRHGCAIVSGGAVECWGSNEDGQLGDGHTADPGSGFLQPVEDLPSMQAIVAGKTHTCALSQEGEVYCWGSNVLGQLGPRLEGNVRESSESPDGDGGVADPGPAEDDRPAKVSGLQESAVGLAAGSTHTCALLESGKVICWGNWRQGQLGVAEPSEELVEVPIDPVVSVSSGGDHNCARFADERVICWGINDFGQLGTGSISVRDLSFSPLLSVQGTGL